MTIPHEENLARLLAKAIELYPSINGIHPAANLLPMMSQEDFENLKIDADQNGFIRPVRIDKDGMVIDGRNRLAVSIAIEKDVPIERFTPSDPIQYVVSENLSRRHLTSQQKAVIAVQAEELYTLFAEQAKAKQAEAGRFDGKDSDGNPKLQVSEKIHEPEKPEKPNDRKTTAKVAKTFGTNDNYVSKAKKVKDHAPDLLPKVASGEVDLNQAAKVATQRKKEEDGAKMEAAPSPKPDLQLAVQVVEESPKTGIETIVSNGYTLHVWHDGAAKTTFNTANESIDWAWSTWNPVTGCLHGCSYCYAERIANNDRMASVYPKGFEPVFHPYRLDAPKHSRNFTDEQIQFKAKERKLDPSIAKVWARNVFVCSMADLFGKWVPDEWIMRVFDSVKQYTQWNYLFLTKYPQRLQSIGEKLGGSFPDNCWVGTTVDEQKRVKIAQDAFANIKAPVKWLSLEPLLTNLEFTDLAMFDMVAIGGETNGGTVTFTPEWSWVENILWQARKSKTSVYFKENLICRPKEMPML